ncbi:MAG: hypothetical protein ACRD0J_18655, partial [Acidimicrobiales bacterium]
MLVEDHPERALGGGLAWARQHRVSEVHVVVPDGRWTGLLARRAGYFDPTPAVWGVDGTALVPAEPEDLVLPAAEAPALPGPALVDLIREEGAEPVVQAGVLRAEVLGLEVARASWRDGAWRLDVG